MTLCERVSDWIHMTPDVECTVKQYAMCLENQWTQPQEKALHYEVPCWQWEVVGVDVFMVMVKLYFVL